ncbi:MAG: Eco57I restriction-modification methylase domain-containing protein [Bacillota bacterium]
MGNEKQLLNSLAYKAFEKFDISKEIFEKKYSLDFSNLKSNNNIEISLDKKMNKEKRKKTGSYYTPLSIVKYMIFIGLKDYLVKNTNYDLIDIEGFLNLKYKNLNLLNILKNIKVVDLSSGTGVFLKEYILLVKEIIEFYDIDNKKRFLKIIIENNIYAFDINNIALNILDLKLHMIYWKYDQSILDINLYNINIITKENFNEFIPGNGFDLVLGNPPYLGEKGNKKVFRKIKKSSFGKKFYEGKMDLLYYFIYRGINILNKKGILVYITSNYFTTANSGKKLRRFLKQEGCFKRIINFDDNKVFDDAILHSMIFSYMKNSNQDVSIYNINKKINKNNFLNKKNLNKFKYILSMEDLFNKNNLINIFVNKEHYSLIKKIQDQCGLKIKDFFNVNQGIVSGADKVTSRNKKKLSNPSKVNKGEGIFTLNSLEATKFREESYCKKFYKNSDIKSFKVNEDKERYLLYVTDQTDIDLKLYNHLKKYKSILENRREVKKGIRKWTSLQWPRDKKMFNKEKIVVPQRSIKNTFAYSNFSLFASADIYYITKKDILFDYNIKVLLGLLNSKLYYIYLLNIGKKKGKNLELYSTPIKNLLIKKLKYKDQIINCVNKLIKNYSNKKFEKLNKIIYKEFNLTIDEIDFINKFYKEKVDG